MMSGRLPGCSASHVADAASTDRLGLHLGIVVGAIGMAVGDVELSTVELMTPLWSRSSTNTHCQLCWFAPDGVCMRATLLPDHLVLRRRSQIETLADRRVVVSNSSLVR